jgi:hypothetical protein
VKGKKTKQTGQLGSRHPDLLRSSGHVNDVLHPGRLLTSEKRISTGGATRKREIMDAAAQFKTSSLAVGNYEPNA